MWRGLLCWLATGLHFASTRGQNLWGGRPDDVLMSVDQILTTQGTLGQGVITATPADPSFATPAFLPNGTSSATVKGRGSFLPEEWLREDSQAIAIFIDEPPPPPPQPPASPGSLIEPYTAIDWQQLWDPAKTFVPQPAIALKAGQTLTLSSLSLLLTKVIDPMGSPWSYISLGQLAPSRLVQVPLGATLQLQDVTLLLSTGDYQFVLRSVCQDADAWTYNPGIVAKGRITRITNLTSRSVGEDDQPGTGGEVRWNNVTLTCPETKKARWPWPCAAQPVSDGSEVLSAAAAALQDTDGRVFLYVTSDLVLAPPSAEGAWPKAIVKNGQQLLFIGDPARPPTLDLLGLADLFASSSNVSFWSYGSTTMAAFYDVTLVNLPLPTYPNGAMSLLSVGLHSFMITRGVLDTQLYPIPQLTLSRCTLVVPDAEVDFLAGAAGRNSSDVWPGEPTTGFELVLQVSDGAVGQASTGRLTLARLRLMSEVLLLNCTLLSASHYTRLPGAVPLLPRSLTWLPQLVAAQDPDTAVQWGMGALAVAAGLQQALTDLIECGVRPGYHPTRLIARTNDDSVPRLSLLEDASKVQIPGYGELTSAGDCAVGAFPLSPSGAHVFVDLQGAIGRFKTVRPITLRNLVLYNLAPGGQYPTGLTDLPPAPLPVGADGPWVNSSLPLWFFDVARSEAALRYGPTPEEVVSSLPAWVTDLGNGVVQLPPRLVLENVTLVVPEPEWRAMVAAVLLHHAPQAVARAREQQQQQRRRQLQQRSQQLRCRQLQRAQDQQLTPCHEAGYTGGSEGLSIQKGQRHVDISDDGERQSLGSGGISPGAPAQSWMGWLGAAAAAPTTTPGADAEAADLDGRGVHRGREARVLNGVGFGFGGFDFGGFDGMDGADDSAQMAPPMPPSYPPSPPSSPPPFPPAPPPSPSYDGAARAALVTFAARSKILRYDYRTGVLVLSIALHYGWQGSNVTITHKLPPGTPQAARLLDYPPLVLPYQELADTPIEVDMDFEIPTYLPMPPPSIQSRNDDHGGSQTKASPDVPGASPPQNDQHGEHRDWVVPTVAVLATLGGAALLAVAALLLVMIYRQSQWRAVSKHRVAYVDVACSRNQATGEPQIVVAGTSTDDGSAGCCTERRPLDKGGLVDSSRYCPVVKQSDPTATTGMHNSTSASSIVSAVSAISRAMASVQRLGHQQGSGIWQSDAAPYGTDDAESQRRIEAFYLNLTSSVTSQSAATTGATGVEHGDGVSLPEIVLALQAELREPDLAVESVLGKGAYGVVYRGLWRGLPVAVKTLVVPGAGQEVEGGRHLAVLETAISMSMAHPNIVATYTYDLKPLVVAPTDADAIVEPTKQADVDGDVGPSDAYKLYIVQEFCNGGTLRNALERGIAGRVRGGGFLRALALRLALDVARGMRHIHDSRIVHGDLKADNILLQVSLPAEQPEEQAWRQYPASTAPATTAAPAKNVAVQLAAKVADFGLSMPLPEGGTHHSHRYHGTPMYMAPEVALNGRLSPRSDVWSYGFVLVEMYFGCTTNQLHNMHAAMVAAGTCSHTSLNAFLFGDMLKSDVPDYTALISQCLRVDPQARPTFNEIVTQLEALTGEG